MVVVTLCFDGGGWTFPYLAGIVKHLQERQETVNAEGIVFKYAGVSSGACVALAAALGVDMDVLMEASMPFARRARLCPLITAGAVSELSKRLIPKDAATLKKLGDRFAIGVSEYTYKATWWSWFMWWRRPNKYSQVVLHNFQSKEDLVSNMVDTCRLPWLNSFSWRSRFYDGGLSKRFFAPPWHSDLTLRLSADAYNSEAFMKRSTPIRRIRSLIPYNVKELHDLYDDGKKDGRILLEIMCEKLI